MAGGAGYELTRSDLIEQLREQLSFIAASGQAFDQGSEGEAKRLAVTIRILLHDTGVSTSLLAHLGAKDRISYLDTSEPINPANLAATPGLVAMQMSNEGMTYVARLEDGPTTPPRWVPFQKWWEDPVTKDSHGELFSRKDYVLTMSNKEGGAHVDHSLDARYADLTRNNSLGWVIETHGEAAKPVEHNPALPSVRQIAYEVEQTLRQHPLKLRLS